MAEDVRVGLRSRVRALVRQQNVLERLDMIQDRSAGVVRVRTGRKKGYVVAWAPEHIERIFVTHQQVYGKSAQYRLLAVVTGDGLLTSEGEHWSAQRRLIQPMFAKRHLHRFAGNMTEAIADFVKEWEQLDDAAPVDAAVAMNRLTLDVVGRALFGAGLAGKAARLGKVLTTGLRVGVRATRLQLLFDTPPWLLTAAQKVVRRSPAWVPGVRTLHEVLDTTDRVVEEIIAAHRGGTDDLLGLLLAAPMERRQVRDEVMTFLLAGHETTANGLAWFWYLLALHPEAREQVEAEVAEVLGGRTPTADDADRLVWTAAAFQEALRLYPPAWSIVRRTVEPDRLGDLDVPAGTNVVIPVHLAHRDPTAWPDPERFDPDRFLPGNAVHRFSYLPFGAGRRICVGAGFAVMEATLIIAMLVQRFRLELEEGAEVSAEATVTLRPRHGIPMRLYKVV
ncbi:cytochrome P450 [Nonomuraea sp. NBC_01738]|uniref:cytochrome P450 n=1 Tax=Nonomuraea sp. NBC_01738 TaxID=2976003 RepID=UPI002E0F46C7|nr:cytochrome P450 [Nonomuraea sp. NBC_01738]